MRNSDKPLPVNRDELIEEILSCGRTMSTSTVLFHQSIAEKAGMSGTDHKYLDILFQSGPITAGKLAELSGLTTGAVTGIIDRLEKQKLVRREQDPQDRRKVLVVLQEDEALKRLAPLFESLRKDFDHLHNQFSNEELKVIHRYLKESISFYEAKIREFKEG